MVIYVNAEGCVNACRHCSAGGGPPYGSFFILDDLRKIAADWGPLVPYFEFSAHPEFPEIMHPDIVGPGWTCPPTTGFGLANREDGTDVFRRLREFGWRALSFTLHGMEERHDWFVGRKGAFETIQKASRRASESGFGVFWQVYLDQRNLSDIPTLVELRRREFDSGEPLWLEIPYHRVSRRLWRYEQLRPRLGDVQGLLEGLDPSAWQGPLKNRPISETTESAWLCAWRERPDADEFGPTNSYWPLAPPFDKVWILIDRKGRVSYDPLIGEPILLGKLSDGKEELMRRLQRVPAPSYSDLSVDHVLLPEGDSDCLHPNGFSVRCKAVSSALYGGHYRNVE